MRAELIRWIGLGTVSASILFLYSNCGQLSSIRLHDGQSAASSTSTITKIRSALQASGARNVRDYGAKGDGKADDTAAFQKAFASGGLVIVPATTAGYKLSAPLVISNSNHVIGIGAPKIISGSETVFWITSSNVEIANFEIDMSSSRSGTSAVYIDTSKSQINWTRLTDFKIENAYHAVMDPPLPSAQSVTGLDMSGINTSGGKDSQIDLQHTTGFIFLKNSSLQASSTATAPLVSLVNNAGSVFDAVTLAGPGGSGFLIENSQAVWINRCQVNAVNGNGVTLQNAEFVYLDDVKVVGALGDGILYTSSASFAIPSTYLQAYNVVVQNSSGSGLHLDGVRNSQWTKLTLTDNGQSGVWLNNSQQNTIANVTSISNLNYGVYETSGADNSLQGYSVSGSGLGIVEMNGAGSIANAAFAADQGDDVSSSTILPSNELKMSDLLKAPAAVSVVDYGAEGDGVTDDTAAFSLAIAAGGTVFVPWTPKGYKIAGVLRIENPVRLIGVAHPNLYSGAGSMFTIASSQVAIHGFTIHMDAATAGTTAYHLDSTARALSSVQIEDTWVWKSFHAVNDSGVGPNKISNLLLDHVYSMVNRDTSLALSNVSTGLRMNRTTVDQTANSGPALFPSFTLANNAGANLTDVFIQGGPDGTIEAQNAFYVLSNVQNFFLNRSMADTSRASGGFVTRGSNGIYLRNTIASLVKGAAFLFASSANVHGLNISVVGTNIAPSVFVNEPAASGLVLVNATFLGTNVSIHDETSTALSADASSNYHFNNYRFSQNAD